MTLIVEAEPSARLRCDRVGRPSRQNAKNSNRAYLVRSYDYDLEAVISFGLA
jgi:hypothetical protein